MKFIILGASHVAMKVLSLIALAVMPWTLRILDAVRLLNLKIKQIYQASTSELYGLVQQVPQMKKPLLSSKSYAVAKLYAYWITVTIDLWYLAYQWYSFNHESPRGGTFVAENHRGLSRIKYNLDDCLYVDNIDSLRDWGHAKDYVEMQWMMLQQKIPQDCDRYR